MKALKQHNPQQYQRSVPDIHLEPLLKKHVQKERTYDTNTWRTYFTCVSQCTVVYYASIFHFQSVMDLYKTRKMPEQREVFLIRSSCRNDPVSDNLNTHMHKATATAPTLQMDMEFL